MFQLVEKIGQQLGVVAADEEAHDDLFDEVRAAVIYANAASTSYLQRKFGIGYARAARLIDMLEQRGVIGAGDGAKPRKVLVSE